MGSTLIYELPKEEYEEWKAAMGFTEDAAVSTCEHVLIYMSQHGGTFPEASASLGIGDPGDSTVTNWYYNHNILYVYEKDVLQA